MFAKVRLSYLAGIRGCCEKCIPLELPHTQQSCDRISIYAMRHNYCMIEHNHVPAKRLEAIQPCCHYITHALIFLTCCLCSIVYSYEVANLCASISSLLILSVAYIIGDVTLSFFLAENK
jgi:hypothetical protein